MKCIFMLVRILYSVFQAFLYLVLLCPAYFFRARLENASHFLLPGLFLSSQTRKCFAFPRCGFSPHKRIKKWILECKHSKSIFILLPGSEGLHIKSEQNNISVFYNVFFSFHSYKTFFSCCRQRTIF